MQGSVIAAIVTGVLAVSGAFVTVVLTQRGERERDREVDLLNRERDRQVNLENRKRDHEADWRKLKIESYKEFFTALSEAFVHEKNEIARSRYLNAVNMLNLVASPTVLEAFKPWQIASDPSITPDPVKQDLLANMFFRAMREDCHPPGSPKDGPNYKFQLFLLPPAPNPPNVPQ